jgi:hypothetical protein
MNEEKVLLAFESNVFSISMITLLDQIVTKPQI